MKKKLQIMLLSFVIIGIMSCSTTKSLTVDANSKTSSFTPIAAKQIYSKALNPALIELVYSPRQNAIFVASPDWKDETKSKVLKLNPDTLEVQAKIPLAGKGFGVALDDETGILYLTQGFNGSISAVDIINNKLKKRIAVEQEINFAKLYKEHGLSKKRTKFLLEQLKKWKITEGFPYKLREMVIDKANNRLFAPGLGLGVDSVLFVINTKTLELEKTIPGFGYNATGIALDSKNNRLFVANMRGQLMTLDTKTLNIVNTQEINADQLLNLVYDEKNNRLFGVDQGIDRKEWRDNHLEIEYKNRSKGHQVFVLDAKTGKTIAIMPTSQVPIGLLYDGKNQRLYVANRGGVYVDKGVGTITIYDTLNYKLLQTIDLPPHPNSLALDKNKNILYVTVKNDGDSAKADRLEKIVRIELSALN